MKITEVRIFPTESRDGKLKAFAAMTFDDWFVVRNVKVIQGTSGLFVAMPSRKALDVCPKCRFKNARGARYCNQCGANIEGKAHAAEETGEDKQAGHMDIAHPITKECRVYIQEEILNAYANNKSTQKEENIQKKPTEENPTEPEVVTQEAQRFEREEVTSFSDTKDIDL